MGDHRVLVGGMGNIFLGDDGFGSEVAQRLLAAEVPPQVKVVDYGIRGFDLAYALLEDWEAVVIVDALPRGEPPGTVTLLEADLADTGDASDVEGDGGFSGHLMTPAAVFALVRTMGGAPRRLLIVGCEPESFGPEYEGRMSLSAAVEAAVPVAVDMVQETVRRLLQDSDQPPGAAGARPAVHGGIAR